MSTSSDAQWLADTAANYKLSTESAENLAFSLPPLEAAHIVEFLGTGTYGAAYRLSNDHVLKVSVPDPLDGTHGKLTPHLRSQLAALKRLQDDQHTCRAKLRHIAVYDAGKGSFMNALEDAAGALDPHAGSTIQNEP